MTCLSGDAGARSRIAVALAIAVLCVPVAHAGNDATFTPVVQQMIDYLEGSIGKVIALVAVASGMVRAVTAGFSMGTVGVPIGIGIGVGAGPGIIDTTIGALI